MTRATIASIRLAACIFALTQELAGVGGDANYIQTVVEGRGYYPIYEGITLVGRLIGGNITGYGGQDVLAVDSFFKGGETIRGFDTSGIGPRALQTDGSGGTDAIGGKIFYAGTLEVRFPIPFLPEELGFSGAVFADAGSLYDTDFAGAGVIERQRSLRSSVGASLLWNSPVGPLRADFAYVLTKADFDQEAILPLRCDDQVLEHGSTAIFAKAPTGGAFVIYEIDARHGTSRLLRPRRPIHPGAHRRGERRRTRRCQPRLRRGHRHPPARRGRPRRYRLSRQSRNICRNSPRPRAAACFLQPKARRARAGRNGGAAVARALSRLRQDAGAVLSRCRRPANRRAPPAPAPLISTPAPGSKTT